LELDLEFIFLLKTDALALMVAASFLFFSLLEFKTLKGEKIKRYSGQQDQLHKKNHPLLKRMDSSCV